LSAQEAVRDIKRVQAEPGSQHLSGRDALRAYYQGRAPAELLH
jgi:hypothetical protein